MGIHYGKGSEQAERRFFLNKWASSKKKKKKKSSLGKVILNFYGTNHPQFMKLIDLRIQTNNKTPKSALLMYAVVLSTDKP